MAVIAGISRFIRGLGARPVYALWVLLRRVLFKLRQFGLKRIELFPGARQNGFLHLELLPGDEVQLAYSCFQNRTKIFLQIVTNRAQRVGNGLREPGCEFFYRIITHSRLIPDPIRKHQWQLRSFNEDMPIAVIAITTQSASSWSNARMKTRHLIIGLLAIALTASSGAIADSIYKWIDADGNIHYEDRPSGAGTEERMTLTYTRTDDDAVEQRIQMRHDTQSAHQEAKAVAAEEARSKEDKRAEALALQQKCENYRGKLEMLTQARRLYREDENGERIYLDDSEQLKARQRADDLVQEFCNS